MFLFLYLEKEELAKSHKLVLESLEKEKQNELTQLRLKCASETASQVGTNNFVLERTLSSPSGLCQVEEEIAALREQLEKSHDEEVESIKLDMESKHSEKMEKLLEQKQNEKECGMWEGMCFHFVPYTDFNEIDRDTKLE